jgi:uncharacterized membrane protein
VRDLETALTISGLVLAAAGVPLMLRRVAPNRWYGIRLRSTLADEGTWYEVNERSGRDLLLVGVAVVVLSLLAPIVLPRWRPEWRVLLVAFVLIVGLASTTTRAVGHARRLRRD